MTFVDFWLELMMIWIFLTGAGVLDDVLDGLHIRVSHFSLFVEKNVLQPFSHCLDL